MGELLRHSDKLCVVRGLNMETLAHQGGRRRFLTGKAPTGTLARGSNASTWLAGKLGEQNLIPNLSLRVESYNQDQPNYATALRVSTVPDLLRALAPADPALSPRLSRQIDEIEGKLACPDSRLSAAWQKAEYARKKGRQVVESNLSSVFNFDARTVEMDQLRSNYNFNRVDNSPAVSVALAAQAITSGISRCVTINLVGGLDTHPGTQWTQVQGPRQEEGFNAIARLVDDLSQRPYDDHSSWLDHTTIIGFSEFSRTPMLNISGGRDHHLTNSCFLLGGGVRGGQVIGASSNVAMHPTAVDIRTGQTAPDGEGFVLSMCSAHSSMKWNRYPDLRVQGIEPLSALYA